MAAPFKRNDLVEVLAGQYSGQIGRVKAVRYSGRRVRHYYQIEVIVPIPPPGIILHDGKVIALKIEQAKRVKPCSSCGGTGMTLVSYPPEGWTFDQSFAELDDCADCRGKGYVAPE